MATVTLRGIVKRYPGAPHDTLKGIDLETRDGEFLVLVGPSGCGKSTLLRIIAGLESITSGELRIGDDLVNNMPPKARDIAMVFQSYALYPHMTVRRNMSFGLEVRRTARAEIDKLVGEAARMLGLTEHLEKLPKALSGGQRQRVAMGRAIVRRPRVFLFDEPLSNLDAALRAQMRVEIKQLHDKLKTTTVYVTHDQVEAMTLADRIAVLDAGILQQLGTPTELFDRPANRFVAGFIGSPSMNFLEAELEPEGADGERDGTWIASTSGGGRLAFAIDGDETGLSADSRVEVGVRPQDVRIVADPDALAENRGFEGSVTLIETLGWESHVHLELDGGARFLASIESSQARTLAVGERVGVHVPAGALHLFDAESGVALAHSPAEPGA